MKQTLTIEGRIDGTGDSLLMRIVIALGQHRVAPETFVWTRIPDSSDARVGLVLDGSETEVSTLVAECRNLPCVRYLSQRSQQEYLHPEPGRASSDVPPIPPPATSKPSPANVSEPPPITD